MITHVHVGATHVHVYDAGEWEERKHPRNNTGEFATSGGAPNNTGAEGTGIQNKVKSSTRLERVSAGQSNQLNSEEQKTALGKIATLKSDKNSTYAEAYNLPSVRVDQLGMVDDGWEISGTRPASQPDYEKFGRVMAVPTEGIGTAQDAISLDGLKAYVAQMPDPKKNGYPEVAATPDGKFHLLSGHTRTGATILGGRSHVVALVLQFDKDNKWVREKPPIPSKG